MNRLGVIVNPMSGRDVRRVAAKASTSTHHDKQQHITRIVLGALEHGVDEILLADEPFKINRRAVENLPARNKVKILKFRLQHSEQDTVQMTQLMWDAGCRVFVVLGGDGTSRIVAKTRPEAIILPLSTGTNNVFPQFVEASIAGAAAGLVASQQIDYKTHCFRCKLIHISVNNVPRDIALIDAVLLQNDHLGSFLPFAAENLSSIFLSRAEPASVGMSPIGGYLMPCSQLDDYGVLVQCGKNRQGRHIRAPISPGLYGNVPIQSVSKMTLDQAYSAQQDAILAVDGDRIIKLNATDELAITIRKDGPFIIEPAKIMASAAKSGLLFEFH
ncbi:MAG: NAD(+)/NADH kinase [Pseudomonadales bacterium]|nr:NAD(+)/NADH kinase [Pseudomonadales bacterium]